MATRYLDENLFPKRKETIRMEFRVPFLNTDRRRLTPTAPQQPWLWDTLDEVLWDAGNTMDY